MDKTKEPKIKWVKSREDIPSGSEHPGAEGMYDKKTNTIYAIKGVTSAAELEHEKYHAIKNQIHGIQKRGHASDYVAEEMQANKYAYSKTGNPRGILQMLRVYLIELVAGKDSVRHVKPSRALELIRRELLKVNPPDTWLDSYRKLVSEAHEAWKERENNSKSVFYKDIEPKVGSLKLVEKKATHSIREKKPRNLKNWWDDKYYQNVTSKNKMKARAQGGSRVLPPNLNGKI